MNKLKNITTLFSLPLGKGWGWANISLTLIMLLLMAVNGMGQNLLPNPSFEDTTAVPTAPYQIDNAIGWTSYKATPDLFSLLSPSWSSVLLPNNQANDAGYQYPYHGNNIAMFLGYSLQSSEKREYIGTTLISPLEIGKTYSVSLYVSLLAIDSSLGYTGAINNVGVLFTNTQYSWSNPLQPTNYAHVYSPSVISDTTGWVHIQDTFVADSAYQYMVIGNFFDDANTTFTKFFPSSPYDYALYFVDSVSVIKVSPNGIEDLFEKDLSVINTANNIILNLSNNYGLTTYSIFNISGQLITSNQFSTNTTINTSNYTEGIYILHLENNQKSYNKKIFIHH